MKRKTVVSCLLIGLVFLPTVRSEEIDLSTNLVIKQELRDAQEAFLKTLGVCPACKGTGVLGPEHNTCIRCSGAGKTIRPIWEGMNREKSAVLQSFEAFVAFIGTGAKNADAVYGDNRLADLMRTTCEIARGVFSDNGKPLQPAKVLTDNCLRIMEDDASPRGKMVAFHCLVSDSPPDEVPAEKGLPAGALVYQVFITDQDNVIDQRVASAFIARERTNKLKSGSRSFILGVIVDRISYTVKSGTRKGHVVLELSSPKALLSSN